MIVIKDELKSTGYEFAIENGDYFWEYEKTIGNDLSGNVIDSSMNIRFIDKANKKSLFIFQCSSYLYTLPINLLDNDLIDFYKYNIKTKDLQKLTIETFAELFFDNDLKFAKKIWQGFKYYLAQLKPHFKNANNFEKGIEKYGFKQINDLDHDTIYLLSYNINSEKAKELFQKLEKDTVKLDVNILENFAPDNIIDKKYEISPEYDIKNSLDVGYEIKFNFLKYQDKSVGEKLVQTLIDKFAEKNKKLNKSELNKGLNLYDGYVKDIQTYNQELTELVEELKQFTGNFEAAPKKLTDEQKEYYIKLCNKLEKYRYIGRNGALGYLHDNCKITDYNDCHKYLNFLYKIQEYIRSLNSGYTPIIELNLGDNFGFEDKSNMATIFVSSSYDIRKEQDENKKDEIYDNKIKDIKAFIDKYYGEKIYISYKDLNGTTYTEKPKRLFWSNNGRLCYFKNNSKKSGYPIDKFNEIYRLDVIDKNKKDNNISKQYSAFFVRTYYNFLKFLKKDWL